MFSHQFLFPPSSNENAVPEHHDSPSEGSETYSFGAPAGDAFVSDGSVDSGIGSLAANDEPYLPTSPQAAPTGHPSPLDYSVAPDYVDSHSGYTSSPSHHHYSNGYADHNDAYTRQYGHPSYVQQPVGADGHWNDQPYTPPGYNPPPRLADYSRHYGRPQPTRSHVPPPPPIPHPPIAPQVQYDLPSSPSSSSMSDASYGKSYSHSPQGVVAQHFPPLLPSPPSGSQFQPEPQVGLGPDPTPSQLPVEYQQGELARPPRSEPPTEEAPKSHQWHETDKYLRNQIGIPEGTKVDLWALPDPPVGQKPQQPLPILVKLAIHGSEKGMLTLQEIYQTLEDRFTHFAEQQSVAWKNSIRHNLSLNQVFRSCDRPITEPGKGRYWSVDISKGEGYKRERRRKRRNAAPYNGTRDLPGGIGNHMNHPDSSDGDQDMEEEVAPVRAPKMKKVRGKRGPYTRVTVGQPSVPGTTGLTPGPAAASSSSATGFADTTTLASGGPAYASTGSPPMGDVVYHGSPMAPGMSMGPASAPSPMPMNSNAAHSASGLVPNRIPGVPLNPAHPLPHPIAPYYQSTYGFSRTTAPTFGRPSLPAAGSFSAMSRQTTHGEVGLGGGNVSYMHHAGARMRTEPDVISISSDSGSSPEMRGQMLVVQQRGHHAGDVHMNA